ncbi:MAG TPA: GAP family protein [Glaciibacter sp.]|nr:GAP family protein [Glaciibacter sp.]
MWTAFGHILPLALAVALSSVPIMATILILLSPNKNRSSVPFLIGWVLGIAATIVGFTLLAQVVPAPSARRSQPAVGALLILIGLGLLIQAVIVWRRDAREGSGIPKWLSAVGSLGPWQAFGLAFLMNLRPKAILLSAAAGLSLRADGLSVNEAWLIIGAYTVISASTVGFLIIGSRLRPQRAETWLVNARDWTIANNRLVTVLIMVIVGVVVIWNGLSRL